MGWVDDLQGKVVGLDTSPLIFYIEEHAIYATLLDPFFEAVKEGQIQLVTSTVTLLEVLVHPLKNKDESLAHKYNDILLTSPNIETIPVTPAIAQVAAELRATNNLRTPDAILLATALNHNAEAFLTNDRDIGQIDSLKVIKVRDLAPPPAP